MDSVDDALCRAMSLSLEDWSDAVEDALEEFLPVLIEAGYVREWGHSSTGSFWALTEAGVKRAKELGCS